MAPVQSKPVSQPDTNTDQRTPRPATLAGTSPRRSSKSRRSPKKRRKSTPQPIRLNLDNKEEEKPEELSPKNYPPHWHVFSVPNEETGTFEHATALPTKPEPILRSNFEHFVTNNYCEGEFLSQCWTMGNGVTKKCTKGCGCLRELFRLVKQEDINPTSSFRRRIRTCTTSF